MKPLSEVMLGLFASMHPDMYQALLDAYDRGYADGQANEASPYGSSDPVLVSEFIDSVTTIKAINAPAAAATPVAAADPVAQ